ncbi:MAG: bifunctional diaminohydroxyphosphoribosylaminopyrimidine deaminase/5-amino-6-(5-phosphoribosylamino)uracil reductase RibD [Ignavibacteriaceae bacterium]|nr:bifunctional diaminohydroxyphosphoribosylaminopyrimidine deaminase/5-amino-6-(5-phosphoribosylamino)uracil reductase RibD [Ignavibacteriaceae bacterium]
MTADDGNDEVFLKRSLELAAKGTGNVSPNPLVGAVVVKNGKVIGEGYHKKYGEAHAEFDALINSTEDAEGATLYCNLEPCCHTKKQTPPCVPLIKSKGISKVVFSNLDPNPDVNGEGIKQLQDNGIEVLTDLLKEEGKELNKFYFNYVKKKIPYIIIKVAQSIDGKISKSKNEQIWLTGEESNRFVHQLRAVHDAVMVGANTIAIDNPQLTVRNVAGRNPKRIILDGKLNINLNANVLISEDVENTWILTSKNSDKEKINKITGKGARVFQFKTDADERLNLKDVLQKLGEEKITSLFVEGGADVFAQFIDGKYFDEIIILQAPITLGEGVNGIPTSSLNHLKKNSSEKIGKDLKLVFKKGE